MQNLLSYRIKAIRYWVRSNKLRNCPQSTSEDLVGVGEVKEISFYSWRREKKDAWAQIIRDIPLLEEGHKLSYTKPPKIQGKVYCHGKEEQDDQGIEDIPKTQIGPGQWKNSPIPPSQGQQVPNNKQ